MNARVFATIEDARAYVLAGDATLTLEFRRFGTHSTYKVTRCKDKAQPDLYFVSLLTQDTAEFKYNCNLVLIDFFVRHGFLSADDRDFFSIVEGLRAAQPLARSRL